MGWYILVLLDYKNTEDYVLKAITYFGLMVLSYGQIFSLIGFNLLGLRTLP